MNEKLIQLKNQLDAKEAENQAILTKGDDFTADDIGKMEANTKTMNDLMGQIEIVSAATGVSAKFADMKGTVTNAIPQGDGGGGADASRFVGSYKSGHADVENKSVLYSEGEGVIEQKTMNVIATKEYHVTFREYLRKGFENLSATERKVLQEGSDPAGGFIVPLEMLNRLIMKLPTPTRVNGFVQNLTASRDALIIPKVNYTTDNIYPTGIRSTWTGEIPASSTVHRVTDPVFGQERIDIYTNMMSMPMTNDLVEDAAFGLVAWASDQFNKTIDLLKDNTILNGTGIAQPSGILLNPGGTGQPDVISLGDPITADGLHDMVWQMPEQYEENGRFLFNKTSTGAYIAKMKDGDGRYLWGAGLQDSGIMNGPNPKQRMLIGETADFSAFMPDRATNAYPILYGDFGGYTLVNRIGFSIQVLRELYAETNQLLLLGRIRFGGKVTEPWRIKAGQQA